MPLHAAPNATELLVEIDFKTLILAHFDESTRLESFRRSGSFKYSNSFEYNPSKTIVGTLQILTKSAKAKSK